MAEPQTERGLRASECLPDAARTVPPADAPPPFRIITWDLELELDPEELGWDAALRGECGVSCIVLYDTATERYHVYGSHDIEAALTHLNQAHLLVGFNTLDFDGVIMESLTKLPLTPPHYDIFTTLREVLGDKVRGYGLKSLAYRTLNGYDISETSGSQVPRLIREGRIAEVIDYCIRDVQLTRQLANHIRDFGWVVGLDGANVPLEAPLLRGSHA